MTLQSSIVAVVRKIVMPVAIALIGIGHAHAQQLCSIRNNLPVASFGVVSVPRDAAIGSWIGQPVTGTVDVACPSISGAGFYLQYYPSASMSALSYAWDTGMPGIGMRVTVSPTGRVLSTIPSGRWDDFADTVPGNAVYYRTFTFTYQLVKTANQVAGGPLTAAKLFSLASHNIPANVTSQGISGPSINNTSIVPVTCSVTTPSIAATLPTLPARKLNPVGTTAGNTAFSIGLSCAAGAKVYVTLTDATTPDNRTNLLTLASGSSASGVQLQILNAGVPVSFGPDSPLPGNPNQWLVGDSDDTSSIPLTVQYVSTGNVTPGTVRGLATVTLSFQ